MPKYQVTIAWVGVKVGDVIETENPINPAFLTNVKELEESAAVLVAAINPEQSQSSPTDTEVKLDKGAICKRLKELGIQFDGRKNAEELAKLLPAE